MFQGHYEKSRQAQMLQMMNIMVNIGWTKEIVNETNLNACSESSQPKKTMTANEWRAEVQKKKQAELDRRSQHIPSTTEENSNETGIHTSNKVFIVDKSYIDKDKKHTEKNQQDIDSTIKKFMLNKEQERAFRIVANHATNCYSESLKMYIGGIGGTGKSQVLKALTHFFSIRKESHRIIVVAPTGSAAALLGGSTYHSVFGINDQGNLVNLPQVRSRLSGVEYIFFDEVSMLSCHDLYKISLRLGQALNRPEEPFGGLSMIFAGDFAQLPPPFGGENSSLYSRVIGAIENDIKRQEEAIGKGLWHQVTTVVILRENMRQKLQTVDDSKLRTALENMRYKDCTPENISFLKSPVSSPFAGRPSVCDPKFRNISIITAKNIHKDAINKLGSQHYAIETNQRLVDFYSDDSIKLSQKSAESAAKKKFNIIKNISPDLQKILWNQPHSATDKHIPGKLSLAVGMPVMIRCNIATEICITKGQEGLVYGWQATTGSNGQQILETLFVKLVNPPSSVQFDGLPENVVPIPPTSTVVVCSLPDDTKVCITRHQVEVLPNFSMTDYASQGKTRPINVADLQYCQSHQSYYTALSRSASAAGTLILQSFHPHMVTGRASNALCQELENLSFWMKLQIYNTLTNCQIVS